MKLDESPCVRHLKSGAVIVRSHLLAPSLFLYFSFSFFLRLYSSFLPLRLQLQLLPQTSTVTHPDIMRASELIPSKHSSQTRSWRRTVVHAVALAQWAVELDSKNADPMAALDAYMESVRYLKCILTRLRRHGAHLEASRLASIVRRVTSNSNESLLLILMSSPSLIASGCACCAWCVGFPSSTTARHGHYPHYHPHSRTRKPAMFTHGRRNPFRIEIIIPAKDWNTQYVRVT